MKVKEICRLRIDAYDDRCAIVSALVNSGYIVSLLDIQRSITADTEYYVVVLEKVVVKKEVGK